MPRSSSKDPHWQAKEVRMTDLNTDETLKFTVNRWLSRTEDDGEIMRELAVQRPGETSLPCELLVLFIVVGWGCFSSW